MSLLSKLLSKEAAKKLNDIVNAVTDTVKAQTAAPRSNAAPAASAPAAADTGAGLSIYDESVPPQEEGQYTFAGSYEEYFAQLFAAEFPGCAVTRERPRNRDAVIFTFTRAGSTALVVEVISESSNPKKLRQDCAAAGIPYLRFYHNHPGWWNTRSYVLGRVNGALSR